MDRMNEEAIGFEALDIELEKKYTMPSMECLIHTSNTFDKWNPLKNINMLDPRTITISEVGNIVGDTVSLPSMNIFEAVSSTSTLVVRYK